VTEQAAAEAIDAEAKATQRQLHAATEADATRVLGEAQAEAETARYGAYKEVETAVILGLAAQELARNLPNIENLTITPDLPTPILNRFAGTGTSASAGTEAA
jgi:regulator of protease activity HflC (stomatin/prohibitin superfamily)